MATKIKAIKCPQCGSEKHEQLDEKRYRCKSCGTEFYIDDDDININVNHHYEYQSQSSSSLNKLLSSGTKIGIVAMLAPVAIVFILFYSALTTDHSKSGFLGMSDDAISVRDDYKSVRLIVYNGRPCYFYILNRDFSLGYGDDNPKYVDGYYYGFRDVESGKILKERLLFSEKELKDHNFRVNFDQSPPLFFYQAHRYFSILNDKSIYEMDPKTLTYTDVSKTLFKGKEAMNVGISEVKYLDRDYGEGFIINNNLSATYYYFPATNRLYTEEAFKYARELTPNQLNGEIRDTTYLELQEENVSETSSKGGMLRLWKIHAKFHLGDPQDFGFYNWIQKTFTQERGERLVSATPLTSWFTGFGGKILYRDSNYIFITFRPTISEDASSVFQLHDAYGNTLWTQALNKFSEFKSVMLYNNKLWFCGALDSSEGRDILQIYGFDLKDGKYKIYNTLQEEYKIKAK